MITFAPVVRYLLFWDSQADRAAPTIAGENGVLDNTPITDLTISPYNRSTQKRYKILLDKRVVLNPPGFATTVVTPFAVPAQRITFSGKRKTSRLIKYDETEDGGVADIVTNSLYSLVVSNVAADQPTITCGYRFYYKDA